MIHYSIEQIDNGYTLTIWESAPVTGDRVKPFLFKAHYTIASRLEALGLVKLVQGGKGTAQIYKGKGGVA